MKDPLDIALKEWAIVCDLLADGQMALVLRKGGIHEEAGPGRFELAHDRFAMLPAHEHQVIDRIREPWRASAIEPSDEPSELPVRCWAQVAGIWPIQQREHFDHLQDLHPWTTEQIDMRFQYKPDRPTYAVLLRAYALAMHVAVPNRASYAGCKSWVDLAQEDAIETAGSTPAIDDRQFTKLYARVKQTLAGN